jgi:hypothetical protein
MTTALPCDHRCPHCWGLSFLAPIVPTVSWEVAAAAAVDSVVCRSVVAEGLLAVSGMSQVYRRKKRR